MKMHLVFFIYVIVSYGVAHAEDGKVIPEVESIRIDDGTVAVLRLGPGFTSSVRLPEEINSVVLGNPSSFKAEHSETEPRLVFFKPITSQPAESNALITTKSGREVTLHLISEGKQAANTRVDFMIEFQRPRSMVLGPTTSSSATSVLAPQSAPETETSKPALKKKPDLIGEELARQRAVASPIWEGKELTAAIGGSTRSGEQMIIGFSVLNRTNRVVELLPPRIELSGRTAHSNGDHPIKAETVPVVEYRLTSLRLAPGERADGVLVFERPGFKQADEGLLLELAETERADKPLLVPLPFVSDRVLEARHELN